MDTYLVFAYVDPGSMMPVASALAAVVGFFLMLGRNSLRMVAQLFGFHKK